MLLNFSIQAIALLIFMGKGIDELAECIHPHPSITEGIQECVRMLLGKSMLKPEALKGKLSCRLNVGGCYQRSTLIKDLVGAVAGNCFIQKKSEAL